MTRQELEHIIRASGDITDQYEFVIVGSQSILGTTATPEAVFTVSMEVDIYPLQAPELADMIDGAIGEGSPFHDSYGDYAQGVGPDTAILPRDWMTRVRRVQNANTNDRVATAWASSICSLPRRLPVGTRIASSARRCSSTDT